MTIGSSVLPSDLARADRRRGHALARHRRRRRAAGAVSMVKVDMAAPSSGARATASPASPQLVDNAQRSPTAVRPTGKCARNYLAWMMEFNMMFERHWHRRFRLAVLLASRRRAVPPQAVLPHDSRAATPMVAASGPGRTLVGRAPLQPAG